MSLSFKQKKSGILTRRIKHIIFKLLFPTKNQVLSDCPFLDIKKWQQKKELQGTKTSAISLHRVSSLHLLYVPLLLQAAKQKVIAGSKKSRYPVFTAECTIERPNELVNGIGNKC